MSQQPILAYDCACVGASIALSTLAGITTRTIGQTAQAAELIPAIDGLMKEASIAYGALSAIVTTVGPGSFTGVRIGLAALHGFVLVNNTPLKTLTTLEAMAWAVSLKPNAPQEFYTALRAGKGEIYAQKFNLLNSAPKAMNDITLHPETKTEWDAPLFSNHIDSADAHYISGPDASVLCQIADKLPTTSLSDALPIYIRPPDALPPAPLAWLQAN